MTDFDTDVVVVGAGLAGLAAALHLHRAGRSVTVYEASDGVGGRIRTDLVDGFRLDRGFQVLLPAYPELPHVVDPAALRLCAFTRGVVSVTDGGRQVLAPSGLPGLRGLGGFAVRHPRAAVGVLGWSARDAVAPDSTMRGLPGRSTERDLAAWGVPTDVVDEVFRPFLGGVFLDPTLATSARLFHLIWRSFLRGGAAVPAAGMSALPELIAATLPAGTVHRGQPVSGVDGTTVRLTAGETVRARAVVVATDATDATGLLPELHAPGWRSVTTWYFDSGALPAGPPTLYLDGETDLRLNTVVLSRVSPDYAPPGRALVSASVPGVRPSTELTDRVRERAARIHRVSPGELALVATYGIERALPVMAEDHPLRRPVRLGAGRYVCGDHRSTSSIQGALLSGRQAATAVLADLGR